MRTLNDYLKENKNLNFREALRIRQMKELKVLMKKIYNPPFYSSKPKFRKPMTQIESELFKKAIKAVYNPKITQEKDVFESLGIKRIAMT